ncbi:RDD family protein [Undibacterium sp. Xuan67W]|uniref:RDD family protein n=1 Tax=Undibacterium sp. Xuan67W TaxID=3413057 RepID=UPI003BF23B11
MNKPDFSKYTEAQLRQVLTRIDTVRFPDRVKEIEEILSARVFPPTRAELNSVVVNAPSIATIADLWRRFGAFLIDFIILGIIGMAAGTVLQTQFAALGAWGRVIGFIITLILLGVSQSSLGGGQSLGMKVFGLRVVSRTGDMLGVRATVIRTTIFGIAYFLNGVNVNLGIGNEWGSIGIAVLVFGLAFSIFYMLIFNRRTRQSIHDLAVGAFVVKAGPGKVNFSTESIWRGHAAIAGVTIIAICIGGIVLSKHFLQSESLASLALTQQAIVKLPGVDGVNINLNSFPSSKGTTNRLLINAFVDASTPNPEALALQIAQTALKNCVEASNQDVIVVTLVSGYDIGIASSWRWRTYPHTPQEWRALPST